MIVIMNSNNYNVSPVITSKRALTRQDSKAPGLPIRDLNKITLGMIVYSCGRSTYVTSTANDFAISALQELNTDTVLAPALSLIEDKINENNAGMSMDVDLEWKPLAVAIREELETRGELERASDDPSYPGEPDLWSSVDDDMIVSISVSTSDYTTVLICCQRLALDAAAYEEAHEVLPSWVPMVPDPHLRRGDDKRTMSGIPDMDTMMRLLRENNSILTRKDKYVILNDIIRSGWSGSIDFISEMASWNAINDDIDDSNGNKITRDMIDGMGLSFIEERNILNACGEYL